MRLEKCWFCGATIYPLHGISFVRLDSKVFHFCSSKCHKNFKMKRNPRKVKWTKAFRSSRNKDMTVDATLDFEKKRNRPLKYDRHLMKTTVRVMKRVEEIKQKRQVDFMKKRIQAQQKLKVMQARKEIERDLSLVELPLARSKVATKMKVTTDVSMVKEREKTKDSV